MLNLKRGRFREIPDNVKEMLVKPALLYEWSPFSIKERVELIERVWNVKTSPTQLARFYKAKGVKYLAAK